MNFYDEIGEMALGSRLRRLGDRFSDSARKLYALYEVDLDPKWFPVFYCLSNNEKMSVTAIANTIGHSHPSVSQIAKEMSKEGIVKLEKNKGDRRITDLSLSAEGRRITPRIADQYQDVSHAVKDLLAECNINLWKALEEVDHALDQKDLYSRVNQIRKERESKLVEIIDYEPKYSESFKKLNYDWIEKYFQIEQSDIDSLEQAELKILEPGGYICFARYHGQIVGTCALIKIDEKSFELAKMAVTEKARGKNIGFLLGTAILNKAMDLGAERVYIESNTKLTPAINLYYKLGFKKIIGKTSPYERCNIQMEIKL